VCPVSRSKLKSFEYLIIILSISYNYTRCFNFVDLSCRTESLLPYNDPTVSPLLGPASPPLSTPTLHGITTPRPLGFSSYEPSSCTYKSIRAIGTGGYYRNNTRVKSIQITIVRIKFRRRFGNRRTTSPGHTSIKTKVKEWMLDMSTEKSQM
jgi:hypothetical protein